MSRLRLSLAISEYDHVRDLVSGALRAEGIELTPLALDVEEIFWRFSRFQEWDVSEMSLGAYVSARSHGDESMVAIPVFPSRVFRHSAFYVATGSDMERLEQLAGRRVGVPEWAQTACVYARGLLAEEAGVRLQDVEWYQGGVNQAGRVEKAQLELPEGVRLTVVADRTLEAMLLGGELDAVITARPPAAWPAGGVRRLLPNARAQEESYWRRTGMFPIMHVVALRAEVVRAHPWVAMSLYKAFDEARRRGVERLFTMGASRIALPWAPDTAEGWRELFGGDYWPYGLEPNRPTLEAFLRYAHEQGVARRLLAPEELFPPSVLSVYRV